MFRLIELPQALEKVYPSLAGQLVLMMLATSVMSQISADELTGDAYQIQALTYRGFEAYLVVAAIYLVLTFLLRGVLFLGGRVAFPGRSSPSPPNGRSMIGLTQQQLAYLLAGTGWTVALSITGLAGETILGFPMALALRSQHGLLRHPVAWAMQTVQGIPLPVLLFLVYFGLSIIGLDLSSTLAAAVSLALYAASYLGEIWAGALAAVPSGQTEAAKALGLRPRQILVKITLPQATRLATAPSVGFSVQLIKNTSCAVVVGVAELTYSAGIVNTTTFQPHHFHAGGCDLLWTLLPALDPG